jgi:hypothetical protein
MSKLAIGGMEIPHSILSVSFPGTADNSGKELHLFTSSNLHRSLSGPYHGSTGGVRTHGEQHYFYTLTSVDRFILSDSFEGNIFGHNAQDLNLKLGLFLGSDARGINQIWRRVIIRDLADVPFGAIYPEPRERSPALIAFEFDPSQETIVIPRSHISLSAIDRELSCRRQFKIFAIGTMTGILASISASIVVDAVKHLDDPYTIRCRRNEAL